MGRLAKLIARSGLVVTFVISLSGCWSSSDSKISRQSETLTTWQGVKVGRDSAALNGLYRGQFDQSGDTSWLLLDGNVIGFNSNYGYLGYLDFDVANQQFDAQLWRFPVITNLFQNQWLVAGGSYVSQTWNGIRFNGQNNQNSLIGDFVTPDAAGSLVLEQVRLASSVTNLATVIDQWQSGEHNLFITDLGLNGRFQGFSPIFSGCSYQGLVSANTSLSNSYLINLTQQQGCEGFNGGPAIGIAVLDDNGSWQWFVHRGSELSFQTFTRASATIDNSGETSEESAGTDVETDLDASSDL